MNTDTYGVVWIFPITPSFEVGQGGQKNHLTFCMSKCQYL